MNSPYVPAGPEAAPTLQTSQPVSSPTSAPQSGPGNSGISTASVVSIVFFLSLFALLVVLAVVFWIQERRRSFKMLDERPSEKEEVRDVEALAAARPIVPITPLSNVRWTPQIRSINGPALDEEAKKKSAASFPKRARSPPPLNLSKSRNSFPGSYPQSAPAHASSFPQYKHLHSVKGPRGEMSPPVTPLALAASGMETRSLGRPGSSPKN